MTFRTPRRMAGVSYEIRGRLHDHALRLEAAGHDVLKLNIGNPAAYGFQAPPAIVAEVAERLVEAQGYSSAKGMNSTRQAAIGYDRGRGIPIHSEESVYLGNGVSDLAMMSLQALLDDGDEVLVPAPGYPVWTAATSLAGGIPVHYLCDETAGWLPDVDAMATMVSGRTKAVVIINPNNPTGAVYPQETLLAIVDLARRHGLVVLSDEIYDQILYDGVRHWATASLASDVTCLTFNGVSKAYLLAGYRSGWLSVTGPRVDTASLCARLDVLTGLRLGANVPGQCALEVALRGAHGPVEQLLPGGRLRDQRDAAFTALSRVPGISCVQPTGGFYAFPRVDHSVWQFADDERLLMDILDRRHVLFSSGSSFFLPGSDHFRVVTLATAGQLEWAAAQLSRHVLEQALVA